jgi:predicted Rossmann fold nucleotide-binding protein DprA/Smf involved in DNA uptake
MIPKSQLISLSEVPGMGPRRIRALLRKFPELEDITNLSKSDMMQVEGISGDLAAKTKGIDLDIGNRAMYKTASMGAKGCQIFHILGFRLSRTFENYL